jgi:deoxyribodipyrimidine photolyase-related protein
MTAAVLVYPQHPALERSRTVYLVEDPLFFSQYAFHRQKLMLHRASMQGYCRELSKAKYTVRYLEADSLKLSQDVVRRLKQDKVSKIYLVDPEDNYLMQRLTRGCREAGIEIQTSPSPNFLTPTEVFQEWLGDKKKLFFTQFYIAQRKRLGYLLNEQGAPIGGKWSFDTENRRKLPKGQKVPALSAPRPDRVAKEARAYVAEKFPKAVGDDRELLYPTSREAALIWLEEFIEQRLAGFGDFEDAIARDEAILFHACLTPSLNIGLISPEDVVERVLAQADRVPLNSLEGFLRQVIGWREFIRAIYRQRGSFQRTRNFWGHTRKIPASFYEGTTGIEPVDVVIQRVLQTGYCHHIERLMILGNFMLLCQFDPDAIYQWFMELFIDAYDWVMVPNVYGMSQHADGGLMTTKPYLSGSSYVLRMSDFRRGAWCDIWDSLYWNFLDQHRSFFERNPRMSVMTKQLDRMGDKLVVHRRRAADFLVQWEP